MIVDQPVEIPAGGASLAGDLNVPADARGVVVFAHGSGSGRSSPRNGAVADELIRAGLATLLLDLLTEAEETVDLRTGHLRFEIGLLAQRVVAPVDWLASVEPVGAATSSRSPGALEQVAAPARDWFMRHLGPRG